MNILDLSHSDHIETFQEAIRRDPSNVKALFREAKCHISLGDATAALRSLGKVKAVEPQHPDLPKEIRHAEQLQHLITEGDKVGCVLNVILLPDFPRISPDGPRSCFSTFHDFLQAYNKGDFRKCVYCMERALRQSADCVKFKLLRGECLVYLNRCVPIFDRFSELLIA